MQSTKLGLNIVLCRFLSLQNNVLLYNELPYQIKHTLNNCHSGLNVRVEVTSTHVQSCHVQYQISLAWQSNSSSPGLSLDKLTPVYPWLGVSQNAGVTPAVPGLTWYYLLPSTPVAEYPRMPGLHRQSQDYPGTTSPPSTPVTEYLKTPELHRQSWDYPGIVDSLSSQQKSV